MLIFSYLKIKWLEKINTSMVIKITMTHTNFFQIEEILVELDELGRITHT